MSDWKVHARTDKGRVRERNEDNYLVEESRGLFAVADGMGGGERGNVASKLFVETLRSSAESLSAFVDEGDPIRDPDHRNQILARFASLFQEANRQIYETGAGGQMGTTADAVILHDHAASIAHVGDSRVYLVQNGSVDQITTDHTYAEVVERTTEMKRPDRAFEDVLTRALGTRPHVAIDTFFVELEPGDSLVLCTDGVMKHLDQEEIHEVAALDSPERVVEELIERSLAGGGLDNTTALAVSIAEESSQEFNSPDTVNTLDKAEILQHIDLFGGLDDARILQLIRYLVTEEFDEGDLIIEEGSDGGAMYVLVSGTASIRRNGESIARVGPGEHVGEMALAEEGRRSANVVADEPVRAMKLAPRQFRKLVESDPETGSSILQNLFHTCVDRLRKTTDQLVLSGPRKSSSQ